MGKCIFWIREGQKEYTSLSEFRDQQRATKDW